METEYCSYSVLPPKGKRTNARRSCKKTSNQAENSDVCEVLNHRCGLKENHHKRVSKRTNSKRVSQKKKVKSVKQTSKPAYVASRKVAQKPVVAVQAKAKPVVAVQAKAKPVVAVQAKAKPVVAVQAKAKPVVAVQAQAKPAVAVQAQAKPVVATKAKSVNAPNKSLEPTKTGYIIVDGKIKYGAYFPLSSPFNEEELELLRNNGYDLEELLEGNKRNGRDSNNYEHLRQYYINKVVPEEEKPLKPEEIEILQKKGFNVEELTNATKNYKYIRSFMNETPLTQEELQTLQKNGWDLNDYRMKGPPSHIRKEYLNLKYADFKAQQEEYSRRSQEEYANTRW